MTPKEQGAPAQQARPKRARIDESSNKIAVIEDNTAPKKTPSEAALSMVKAAVALRPDATQEVVQDVLKEHIKLKTKLREMKNSRERMNNEAFMPRSARFSFELTSSPSIMETEEFRTLAAAMKADMEAFSKKCKERISQVQELVQKGTQEDLRKHFYLGLKRIAIMLMHEHKTYTDDNPCPYARFVYWMTNAPDRISFGTYQANETTQQLCSQEFKQAIVGSEDQAPFTLTTEETLFYPTLRDEMVKIVKAVFFSAWEHMETTRTETDAHIRLKKTAIEMINKEKTEAAAMEVEAEPSADPKVIRDLIQEGIKKETAALRKEVNKLSQTVQRSNPSKNSNRGASSPSPRASSTKKNGKGPGKGDNNAKEKGKKIEKKNNSKKPSPKKRREPSPGRKEPASPSANKKKGKQPGGPKQQQKKGNGRQKKPTSS
jgi:hypothetical protein